MVHRALTRPTVLIRAAVAGATLAVLAVAALLAPVPAGAAAPPIVVPSDLRVTEADQNRTVDVTFTITAAPTQLFASARWQTRTLSVPHAATTADFVPASGTVVFSRTGPRSVTAPVTILGDRITDNYGSGGSEVFEIVITGASGAQIGEPATIAIVDDEQPPCPQITASVTGIPAGTPGQAVEPAVTEVTRLLLLLTNRAQWSPIGANVTCRVAVRLVGGSATPGADFVAVPEPFVVGLTPNIVTVPTSVPIEVLRDGLAEGDETVVYAVTDATDPERVYATLTSTIHDRP